MRVPGGPGFRGSLASVPGMRTLAAILLAGSMLACGDAATTTSDASGAAGLDPAAAATCAELAGVSIAVGQLLFDYGNAVSGEELAEAVGAIQQENPPAELADYVRLTDEVAARAPELCDGPEFQALFCARLDELVSETEGTDTLLEFLYEGCGA